MSRPPERIAAGVYRIGLGGVNAFLIDIDDDGAGAAGRAPAGAPSPAASS